MPIVNPPLKSKNRKVQPNHKCICGSGRKFKHCCKNKNIHRLIFSDYPYSIFYDLNSLKQLEPKGELTTVKVILGKISSINASTILFREEGRLGTRNLVGERQYEFYLHPDGELDFLKFYLIIKNKIDFLTHQSSFSYSSSRNWQRVPIDYQTLSKMTDEELFLVYSDLD